MTVQEKITKPQIDLYPFEVRIEQDNNAVEYAVRFLDVPNIIGSGASIDEAIVEARGNLKEYLDYLIDTNRDIPLPSTDKSFYDLSGKMTLRVSKTTHWKILQRANLEGVSVNSLLNEAIISYLNDIIYAKNSSASSNSVDKEDGCADRLKRPISK